MLEQETKDLLKAYLLNFVRPEVIAAAVDITTVDFTSRSNQKVNEDITIGHAASRFLISIEDETDPTSIAKFYDSVRAGYAAAVQKLFKKFPFSNDTLRAVQLLNPHARQKVSEREVLEVAEKFMKDASDEHLDELLDEWKMYQAASNLPQIPDNADELDIWWCSLLKRSDGVGKPLFMELAKLIRILLILPYNQAPVERLFSMLRKIDTKFRPSLSNNTISSLLACKLNCSVDCYKLSVPSELRVKVKRATRLYNTEIAQRSSSAEQ